MFVVGFDKWIMKIEFPFFSQTDATDCGPACLRMVAKYYGKTYSRQHLHELCSPSSEGTSVLNLRHAAESIGLRAFAVSVSCETLPRVPLPAIAYRRGHFIVIYMFQKNKVYVADPAYGLLIHTKREFLEDWLNLKKNQGVLLLLEPRPDF